MPEAKVIWKRIALSGVLLTLAAAASILVFDDFNDEIFDAIATGLLVLLVGLIGWAAQLGRKARARIAGLALIPPALLAIIGTLTNPNIHGVFPVFFLASVPLFVVGIVVGIMALAARRS